MAFAILEIDDTVPEEEGAAIRERLLQRAFVAAERSTRKERGLTRKVADFVIRVDHYLFISLGGVSAGTLRVPLGRIVTQMRNELFATPDIHAMRLRRRLAIGVAHWLPEVGYITEPMMFAKAWQAFVQAKELGGLEDSAGYLGLTPSNIDLVQVQVYDWSVPATKPKGGTGNLVQSQRPPVVAKTAPAKPAKKAWEFWK